MVNGMDSEQFVVLSNVRPGFKREFCFAMKAHTEISGSLGRTRASRNQNVGQVLIRPDQKLSRKFVSVEGSNFEQKGENLNYAVMKIKGYGEGGDVGDIMSKIKANKIDAEGPKNQVMESVGKCEEALDDDDEAKSSVDDFVVVEDEANKVVDGVRKVFCHSEVKEGKVYCSSEDDDVGGRSPTLLAHNDGFDVNVRKPVRRFTRLAPREKLDGDHDVAKVGDNGGNDGSAKLAKVVEVGGGDARNVVNVVSNDVVEVRDDVKEGSEDDTLVSTFTHMKVSKPTITQTRFPSNIKDLLVTRIFDGLPVKYVRGHKTRQLGESGHLQGVIRGNMIVCHCENCHGIEVVTPTMFELHAGSSKKRPLEYICLKNGTSFRHIINTCFNSPLHVLEEALQKILGSFTMKKSTICFNCKGVNVVSRLLCNLCLETKECQPSPTQATNTSSSNVSPAAQLRSLEQVVVPKPLSNNGMKHTPSHVNSGGRLTRKDLGLHKSVFEELQDGEKLTYRVRGQQLLDGHKKGFAIVCSCCNFEVSPSQFEAHAGWASRRKPYSHIFTRKGVSLHELSITLSKERKFPICKRDDLCSICHDRGDLLSCDGCPRAFHIDCVPLPCAPTGDWYCKYCEHMYHKDNNVEQNAKALGAGRIAVTDPLAQRRCIRIVKTQWVEHEGCLLCRRNYFSKKFSPQTIIICDQCEKEYHVKCLKDHDIEILEALPEGNWFCCSNCNEIHTALGNLVAGGEENLAGSLISLIRRKHNKKGLKTKAGPNIKWRVLNWHLVASDKTRQLLSKAVAILHERFEPILSDKKDDLIPAMLYGRKVGDYDFSGMYCAMLTVNQVVVSVGVFRIFGEEVAELPLVATPAKCEGKGYFQALFASIESLLATLKVKHLILPSTEKSESIWTNKFGFTRLEQEEIDNYRRRLRMMTFQGASLLKKPVPALK